ncbi:hypothetical protein OIE43_30220 [Streptomyces pseudovenezuelae]|uniref:hypothetical protein n=1 Tax=Streptomyces pseudovenezuelae TaxID=67350 RepID=UPI002E319768|nr:hypothetical protein [Streptomyces pseudovenezuelae]
MIRDPWGIATLAFLLIAVLSAVALALRTKPKFPVRTAGSDTQETPFSDAMFIDDELREWLQSHFDRTHPVLRVWQRRAWIYGWMHYYAVTWTTLISLSLPFLIPYSSHGFYQRIFAQVVSAFGATVYGMHEAFKIRDNYIRFRMHESNVYSLIRRIKDAPETFGDSNEKIIRRYSLEVEAVREQARADELGNVAKITKMDRG